MRFTRYPAYFTLETLNILAELYKSPDNGTLIGWWKSIGLIVFFPFGSFWEWYVAKCLKSHPQITALTNKQEWVWSNELRQFDLELSSFLEGYLYFCVWLKFCLCQTPVLVQVFSSRLRLGVDFTFAWSQQEEEEEEESSPNFSLWNKLYGSVGGAGTLGSHACRE